MRRPLMGGKRGRRMRQVVEWAKRHPELYQLGRPARLWAGRHLARPLELPGVPGRVHPNDLMMPWGHPGKEAAYVAGGTSCLDVIRESLGAVDRVAEDVGSWLDFGCGHGRVVRHLVQAVPPDRVWVTDLNPEGVRFCASEFGVHPASGANAGASPGGRGFDVIYAFSVLTHLPEQAGRELLATLGRAVAPGGIVVITIHGAMSLGRIEEHGRWLADHVEAIKAEVAARGFSYRAYPYYRGTGYGLTWHAAGYVTDAMATLHGGALALVGHMPPGPHTIQDALVYQRC